MPRTIKFLLVRKLISDVILLQQRYKCQIKAVQHKLQLLQFLDFKEIV